MSDEEARRQLRQAMDNFKRAWRNLRYNWNRMLAALRGELDD